MKQRVALSLLVLRLTVFLVMLMWSLQKLVNPDGAAGIFASFYFIEGLTAPIIYTIALAQLAVEVAFVLGLARFWTYGFVLVTHAMSTLSSWQQYLDPFNHMLFLAAIPMLGACFTLFMLRNADNLLSLGGSER